MSCLIASSHVGLGMYFLIMRLLQIYAYIWQSLCPWQTQEGWKEFQDWIIPNWQLPLLTLFFGVFRLSASNHTVRGSTDDWEIRPNHCGAQGERGTWGAAYWMEALVGCSEPGCCLGRIGGRGGGRRSCTQPAIPGGLGNWSCAVKKLCCGGNMARPPPAGGGQAPARHGGCPRAAGRPGARQREPAELSFELSGSEWLTSNKVITRMRCCGACWNRTGIAWNRAIRIAYIFIFQHILDFFSGYIAFFAICTHFDIFANFSIFCHFLNILFYMHKKYANICTNTFLFSKKHANLCKLECLHENMQIYVKIWTRNEIICK